MMKKYLTNLLSFVLFFLTATLATSTLAADDAAISKADESATSQMETLRQEIRDNKKLIVEKNMTLTGSEAKAFWPIYESYQKDLNKLNVRLANVTSDYADAYNNSPVLDSTAKTLLKEYLAIELAEAKLKQSYVSKLSKVLPDVKVARYMQIESKIRAVIRYILADNIPLVD
jgi:hypothetical protein